LQVEHIFGVSEAELVDDMAISPDQWGPQLKQRYQAGLANAARAAAAANQAIAAPSAAEVDEAIRALRAIADPPSAVAGAAEVSRRH
jgi:hypothetical protein